MTEAPMSARIPVPERTLRDTAKNTKNILPNFEQLDESLGVKQLHDIVDPLLETADVVDLPSPHRAAAINALCAILENCQSSRVAYVQDALLDDSVWFRLLEIFLQRSDSSKGKSMRQMLLVLTGVLQKHEGPLSDELAARATSTFLDIICLRQDRVKVKPALQGLSHFLLKNTVSLQGLLGLYASMVQSPLEGLAAKCSTVQALLSKFLSWVVHHDTALSTGHLVKNFLSHVRKSEAELGASTYEGPYHPLWIVPVVEILQHWPDRIQEFKTHIFPHCFLPDVDEYARFLSYLHFKDHIPESGELPSSLLIYNKSKSSLETFEEFKILLATIETGKELGVIKDIDFRQCKQLAIHDGAIHIPDNLFSGWLSHPKPEVRIAGLFLSTYSTAITRPLTAGILDSIKRNLIHLHADTDANFRKELLNHTQRLFDRLRGSTTALSKIDKSQTGLEAVNGRIPITSIGSRNARHGASSHGTSSHGQLSESLFFVKWYLGFIEWELRATSSYQRRITALRCLSIVIRSGIDPNVPYHHLSKAAQGQLRWVYGLRVINSSLVRMMLDLAFDPFDDIRSASVATLDVCLDSLSEAEKMPILSSFSSLLVRAEATMLRTGRADQADGLARTYALLFSQCTEVVPFGMEEVAGTWTKTAIAGRLIGQLEATIEVAQKDLSKAVDGRPVHGIFAALRYIVDQDSFYQDLAALPSDSQIFWKDAHHRIFELFESLWTCISDVLCADAPEGHVPEEFDEDASLDTKEILSYSWRGLKEASALLRTIITRGPIGTNDSDVMTFQDVEKFGKLCYMQLVELRHRGAFSSVAQTFSAFCRRCAISKDDTIRSLLLGWYQDTLLSIQDKATSITRRSAGIPSLITGILAAETTPGPLFDQAIRDLTQVASQEALSSNIEESRLPQVHALNGVKEIFASSKLSVASESHIGEGLEIAARMLNSNIWPIRNCSLMLFKALIERLLGSDEAQDWKEKDRAKTSRFSYENYPSLVGILTDLLNPNGPLKKSMITAEGNSPMDLHGAEGVFPALQILRQAIPPEASRPQITRYVLNLLESPHWHLRDMAARTVVSLKHPYEYRDTILDLLSRTGENHNAQHGTLLCLKYLLRKYLQDDKRIDSDTLRSVQDRLLETFHDAYNKDSSPVVMAAYLDLVVLSGMLLLSRQLQVSRSIESWNGLFSTLYAHQQKIDKSSPGFALFRASAMQGSLINYVLMYAASEREEISAESSLEFRARLLQEAELDPDSCCALLDLFPLIIDLTSTSSLSRSIPDLFGHLYRLALCGVDREVVSKAQILLADAFSDHRKLRRMVLMGLENNEISKGLETFEQQCLYGAPANMQGALPLYSSLLDHALSSLDRDPTIILQRLARYIRLLRMTIIDTNPFDTRFAAVQSLLSLDHIWEEPKDAKLASEHDTCILGLSIVLYDLLSDDDDEIRDAAAVATSRLLCAKGFAQSSQLAVPIVSTQHLSIFLSRYYSDSKLLCGEALRRLIGSSSTKTLFTVPFEETLAEDRKEDNALFAQEKQNLFKDDTIDVATWTRVLKALSPRASASFVQNLRTWALEGLQVLTQTVLKERDGPLGWVSKPEVFVLGVKVICAADIALKWDRMGGGDLRLALTKFMDAAVMGELHGLWLERAQRVLGGDVLELIRCVHTPLSFW